MSLNFKQMRQLINSLAYLSLLWGIIINAAVTLNLSFALPLAAGGQYGNFPAWLRIIYLFQMLLIMYELRVFNRLVSGRSVRPRWVVTIFIWLSIFGVIANIFSKSPAERWNAVGLAITAYAFLTLRKSVTN